MKSIRVLLSGIAVYFIVAMIHGCKVGGPSPTFGSSVASSSSGGSGGHGGMVSGGGGSGGASVASASGAGGMGGMMNPVGDAIADSGSRIKAQWIVGDDGSKSFAGFYDSMRKERCSYLTMYDGVYHCVPLFTSIGFSGYYSDPGCTAGLHIVTASACSMIQYKYAYDVPLGECIYRFYDLLQIATPAQVYSKNGNTCSASASGVPTSTYFLKAAELLPSALVAATLTTDP